MDKVKINTAVHNAIKSRGLSKAEQKEIQQEVLDELYPEAKKIRDLVDKYGVMIQTDSGDLIEFAWKSFLLFCNELTRLQREQCLKEAQIIKNVDDGPVIADDTILNAKNPMSGAYRLYGPIK